MDNIIPYDNIMEMLKSPPPLAPRPNFFHLRVFRRHIIDVMKQIPHPGYPQHGWAGMVLQPAIFSLVNAVPFVPPPNPGLIAVYLPFALTPAIKMIYNQFKINKNMFKTYTNIHQAIYKLLMDNVLPQYQASNTPGLTGWDTTMTIIDIFSQMDTMFRKPDAQAILINNAQFWAPLQSAETPETLFLCLNECQEVQILADNPYTNKRLIVNAVLLLQKSNIFPTKDFDDWDAIPVKMWSTLKNFFHEAFTRGLNAISMFSTSGQHGYANPNPYTIFNTTLNNDSTSTASTHHTIAAAMVPTVGSTLSGSNNTHMSPEVASALAQLSSNQNALMMQVAALSVVPPLHPPNHITIPMGNQFARGGGYHGQGGGRYCGQGGGTYGGCGCGGRNRGRGLGSFAQATQYGTIPPAGGEIAPLFGGSIPVTGTTTVPKPVKRFNNWNYCYSCGFDVEDGHTSMTCPRDRRKTGHQEVPRMYMQ
jgi:hypothetical protein